MLQQNNPTNTITSTPSVVSVTLSALNSYRRVLYVGNLSPQVTKDVLFNLFIPFGEVLDVTIPSAMNQSETLTGSKHKGYAFVEFELPEDATEALENLNNSELCGRIITVNYSKASNLSKEAFSDLNVPLWSLNQQEKPPSNETSSSSPSTQQEEAEPSSSDTTNPSLSEHEPTPKKTKL
ncbi:hypothetical protein FDP41_003205 [Naegleria fowleri]|uniref:RRM domain-containing protein n=1 Tax=Naegleria fowleri TaxID=5763 RepID=A0A6A5BIZ3_NAEFO|nr:uncharacterized protein FDP41_003205 [Naegleria fowleri]KAF0977883.1 hypothetical protein FDP41_003205 [Naegleria fowleri]